MKSFVIKERANLSSSAIGAERSEMSALLYFLFWSCSFSSCSRTPSSTSATAVNLQTRKHIQDSCFNWRANLRRNQRMPLPLLEELQTGVHWTSNAGQLLPALPLRKLLVGERCNSLGRFIQNVHQLLQHSLTNA